MSPEDATGASEERRDDESQHPKVNDKRRLDPETGELRDPATSGAAAAAGEAPSEGDAEPGIEIPDDISELTDPNAAAAAEALDQLKRINAEYANYRKKEEERRAAMRELGTFTALEPLLPVLDELELARQHGDLEGPFAVHAEKLLAALAKAGLEQFGAVGEEFDPKVHEALTSQPSADVTTTTVSLVAAPGYRVNDRVLRAAKVIVLQPE